MLWAVGFNNLRPGVAGLQAHRGTAPVMVYRCLTINQATLMINIIAGRPGLASRGLGESQSLLLFHAL